MLNLRPFKVISFDCYGTLIDWESGLLAALAPFRAEFAPGAGDNEILERYALLETQLEAGEYLRYRDVLRGVMRGLATAYGAPAARVNLDTLADSLPDWKPFPDTVPALRRLHRHVKLAIISNTDDDLFAATSRWLEVPFDYVVTAEQVGGYKPSPANFARALETFAVPREHWLHAAQSRFHDVAPARALGVATVWVNRRHDKPGEGATALSHAVPDLEVPNLATLAEMVDSCASD